MNRKLHNTVMALITSSSLFVLGLLTASPVVPDLPPPSSGSAVASLDALDTGDMPAADGIEAEATSTDAAPRRHLRRGRQQSVAMPFFSFAPRG